MPFKLFPLVRWRSAFLVLWEPNCLQRFKDAFTRLRRSTKSFGNLVQHSFYKHSAEALR